ncbi:hypothetical protein CK203_062375 [Vitis vinifera]|uniref:Uncharacterized protein n=1 Tax=Vitis vinifera TaxID=29760 RepID=A0A438FSP0_VITVI|nr:hypothetical protein CK203_062375 [Vitis vinifera]
MAKTRGGLSASPSSPTPIGHSEPPWEPHLHSPVQAPAIPPSEGEAPSQRRYPTRRPPADPVPPVEQATSPISRPLRRGPGSQVLESHPTYLSHNQLQRNLGFQSTCLPEAIIRRPMIAGPPIEAARAQRFIPTAAEGDFYNLGIDQERASIWDAPH